MMTSRCLLIVVAILTGHVVSAQCDLTWKVDSVNTIKEIVQSADYIKGIDGYEMPRKFLDSCIAYIKDTNWVIRDVFRLKVNINDSTRRSLINKFAELSSLDFYIFNYKGKDIAHYSREKYDSIHLHRFSYCDSNMLKWNEHCAVNNFFYVEKFGIVAKEKLDLVNFASIQQRLENNTCLSNTENEVVKRLVSLIVEKDAIEAQEQNIKVIKLIEKY